jgi:DNA-binding transcriptional regulator YiaG
MEPVLHGALGEAVTRPAPPWMLEPTSNIHRFAQQTGASELGDLIGAYIFLAYPEPQPKRIFLSFDLNEFGKTFGKTLIESALIHALAVEGRATTTPQQISLLWRHAPEIKRTRRFAQHDRTIAQTLLAKIQNRSGLTLEEIAPLLGVSRRSLQNWRAERRISARKEQRLRDLSDTLDALPIADRNQLRRMLLDRIPGSARPYDVLADGQFDLAYSMLAHSPAPAHLVARASKPSVPRGPSLIDRLSVRDDGPSLPTARVNLRQSKRLKR